MGGVMARRRRQPYAPPPVAVDLGPDTPAQRRGAVYEERVHRSVQVKGKRREHPLDRLYSHGVITEPQRKAGFDLLDAWCACQLSPAQSGIFIDSTPDFAALALQAAERNFRWSALMALVPLSSRHVIGHVVLNGSPLYTLPGYLRSEKPRVVNAGMAARYREELRAGLDSIRAGT